MSFFKFAHCTRNVQFYAMHSLKFSIRLPNIFSCMHIHCNCNPTFERLALIISNKYGNLENIIEFRQQKMILVVLQGFHFFFYYKFVMDNFWYAAAALPRECRVMHEILESCHTRKNLERRTKAGVGQVFVLILRVRILSSSEI